MEQFEDWPRQKSPYYGPLVADIQYVNGVNTLFPGDSVWVMKKLRRIRRALGRLIRESRKWTMVRRARLAVLIPVGVVVVGAQTLLRYFTGMR